VGGRLVAFDARARINRIEPSARLVADALGVRLAFGEPLAPSGRARLVEALAEVVCEALAGGEPSALGRALRLTRPLELNGQRPAAVTFSGGVAEYLYGRQTTRYGDLGPELAAALQRAAQSGRLPARPVALDEGIRATVIGASQFSVQLSGNTVHVSDAGTLPLRNVPVAYAQLGNGAPRAEAVAAVIERALRRLDLAEGEAPVAIALAWRGEPHYSHLRALADGIVRALPRTLAAGLPLVIALDADVGASLGGILSEELDVDSPLVSIDGLELVELDYIDVGQLIQPSGVVPVVVKSLAFGGSQRVHSTTS
jgi:ethanolamine utilization protein EutA